MDPKNNSLPTPPLNKKLKRKSRAVANRRFTKDEDISNDEAKALCNVEPEEFSLNDESGEANEETIAKPSVLLKRRRTKSIMPPTRSKAAQALYDEPEESSLNNESGEANEETIAKPSVLLKRRRTKSIMPPSKAKAVPISDTENDDEDDLEEQVENLKLNRKSVGHKKALATALANIHRAPTPARIMNSQENITNDDMRRASSAK